MTCTPDIFTIANSIFNYLLMQKNKRKGQKVLALVMTACAAVMLLAGCQQGPAAPSKPAEQVIREGMVKLTEITSYSYEVAFDGEVKDIEGAAIKFDVNLGGQVDVKDPKNPQVTLQVAGSGSDDKDNGGDGSFDLRLNKEALYFNVAKLNLKGAGQIPSEVTDMFGKWWKITLPPEAADELARSVPQGEESNFTPEQLKIKKAMEEANFFSKPVYVGVENVRGENCYHYSVILDKKGFLDFLKKAGEAQGQAPTSDEMAQAEKAFEKIDVTGDVYVGVDSGLLHKFSGVVKVTGTDAGEPSGTISLTMEVWDVGKPVTIQVPKDATEFPIEQFLGPLMMGGAMPGGDESGLDMSVSGMEDIGDF